jgi:hypothetical protein
LPHLWGEFMSRFIGITTLSELTSQKAFNLKLKLLLRKS